MSVKQIGKKRCTFSSHRNADRLLKYSASKFYKYIVNIENVVFGVRCLATSLILNKMRIKSMNQNIQVSSLKMLYSGIES